MLKIVVFDVSNLAYRSLYVHDKDRHHSNPSPLVLFGIFKQLLPRLREFEPDHIVFAYDSKIKKRREIDQLYKANRTALPFPEITQFRRAMAITNIGTNLIQTGYEGDDHIAAVVTTYGRTHKIRIVSGDEDLYQCLLPTTTVYSPNKKKVLTIRWFLHKYRIYPSQWPLVKAIAGCKSDNIAGIQGCGEKSAIKYINNQLSETHNLYSHIHKQPFISAKNLELTTLPFPGTKSVILNTDRPNLRKFLSICEQYRFDSILRNISEWKYLLRL